MPDAPEIVIDPGESKQLVAPLLSQESVTLLFGWMLVLEDWKVGLLGAEFGCAGVGVAVAAGLFGLGVGVPGLGVAGFGVGVLGLGVAGLGVAVGAGVGTIHSLFGGIQPPVHGVAAVAVSTVPVTILTTSIKTELSV